MNNKEQEYLAAITCQECGEDYNPKEKDMILIKSSSLPLYVCENCYDQFYGACEQCGCVKHEDHLTTTSIGDTVCDYCRNRYYITCENCNEYHHEDSINKIEIYGRGDCYICDSCIDIYHSCEE